MTGWRLERVVALAEAAERIRARARKFDNGPMRLGMERAANEVDALNRYEHLELFTYCGGDHCSGLWHLPCDDPGHPRISRMRTEQS